MTFATGNGITGNRRRAGAFTLVELILVMALLVMAVSLVMPTLSRFFGGRAVDSELKKFVALLHYGQTRAIGEGIAMVLWIDSAHGSYGLEQDSTFGKDPSAVENSVANGVKIDVARNAARQAVANSQTGRILTGQVLQRRNRLPAINFLTDGTINAATSVLGVSLQDKNNAPVWIVPSDSQFGYEVQSENPSHRH